MLKYIFTCTLEISILGAGPDRSSAPHILVGPGVPSRLEMAELHWLSPGDGLLPDPELCWNLKVIKSLIDKNVDLVQPS